ncbi:hypothetical protein POM88_026953 [Heracleum sosnowskyi]|uniref:Uncharacterized protein n=1 Tax=Heracleum sosnowskyi TaxID=360622 RepID=A0AAD8MPP5_9APIA|nr:hypothetical protein POM88_026953 [Heracleum sosnowskyi]
MKYSRCLVIGHNKATCKATEAEALENHRKADEARKAQDEAAREHSLRRKQNTTGAQSSTDAQSSLDQSSPQAPLTQEVPTEAAQKKRRGRPPKTSNIQVQTRKMPAGMGVFIGGDGHTYMSSSRSIVRLTDSEPNTTTQDADQVPRQPSKSPLKKGGQMVFPRRELKK